MKGKWEYMQKLNSMTAKDLVSERKSLRKELYELKSKNSIRWLKETHKIGDVKVKIARINTVLKSKIAA
jgi:ribosomal protein L29